MALADVNQLGHINGALTKCFNGLMKGRKTVFMHELWTGTRLSECECSSPSYMLLRPANQINCFRQDKQRACTKCKIG